jgi:hypothetical protein
LSFDVSMLQAATQFAQSYMPLVTRLLEYGRAMLAMIWNGSFQVPGNSANGPLERLCRAAGGSSRRGWVSLDQREAAFVAASAVNKLLRDVADVVSHRPHQYNFPLETLMAKWYSDGGRPCLAETDAQNSSALFLDAVATTTRLIGDIYTHDFFDIMEDQHPDPAGHIDYGTSASDVASLVAAHTLLSSRYLEQACTYVLRDSAEFIRQCEFGMVADDFKAVLAGSAMPTATSTMAPPRQTHEWVAEISQWVLSFALGVKRSPGPGPLTATATAAAAPPQSPAPAAVGPPRPLRQPTSTFPPPPAPTRAQPIQVQSPFATPATGDVQNFFQAPGAPGSFVAAHKNSSSRSRATQSPPKRLAEARMPKRVSPEPPKGPSSAHARPRARQAARPPPLAGEMGDAPRPSPPSSADVSPVSPGASLALAPSPPSSSSPQPSNNEGAGLFSDDSGDDDAVPGLRETSLLMSDEFALRLQLHDDANGAEQAAQRRRRQLEAEAKARREAEEKKRKLEEAARAEAERLRKAGLLRKPHHPFVFALGDGWLDKTTAVMAMASAAPQVLATAPGRLKLAAKDFHTLLPEVEWLNDEIVNSALAHLDDYVNSRAGIANVKTQTRKIAVFNSFFQPRLAKDPAGTRSQLARMGITKDNFLDIETMLIPVCQHSHWTLLYIRPTKRTVAHIDSMNRGGSDVLKAQALAWIRVMLQDKWVVDEWRMARCPGPMQPNAYDCGVHTITNSICVALGLDPDLSYRSEDMALQRHRIGAMLLNGGFKGDFDLARF